jgi:DNA topoisomerase-1
MPRNCGASARSRFPPAYEQVWICPLANGHLQATGRDARGRKQYRYHPLWQELQGQTKFERLLDTTYVRVGNAEYVRANNSYGLTTLRCRHAAVKGSVLKLSFPGKSGVRQRVEVNDPRLARIVRQCQALPGQELFRYLGDDGQPHRVDSADVNAYLREASGGDFSAKDFRTWHASALALDRLLGIAPPAGARIRAVIADVAARLGHTVTVCRQAYVHHAVLERYAEGRLPSACEGKLDTRELRRREAQLLAVLESTAATDRPVAAAWSGARS